MVALMYRTNVQKDQISNHNEQFEKPLAADYPRVRDPDPLEMVKKHNKMIFNNPPLICRGIQFPVTQTRDT